MSSKPNIPLTFQKFKDTFRVRKTVGTTLASLISAHIVVTPGIKIDTSSFSCGVCLDIAGHLDGTGTSKDLKTELMALAVLRAEILEDKIRVYERLLRYSDARADGVLEEALYMEGLTVPEYLMIAKVAENGSLIEQEALNKAREDADDPDSWRLIRDYFEVGSEEWEYADGVAISFLEKIYEQVFVQSEDEE